MTSEQIAVSYLEAIHIAIGQGNLQAVRIYTRMSARMLRHASYLYGLVDVE